MFLDGNIRMCKNISSIDKLFTLKSDYFDFVSFSNYILLDQYLLPNNAPKKMQLPCVKTKRKSKQRL